MIPLNNNINPAVTNAREKLNRICGFIKIIFIFYFKLPSYKVLKNNSFVYNI